MGLVCAKACSCVRFCSLVVVFFNVVFIFHVHDKAICIKKWNYWHFYVKEFTSHAAPRWDGRRRSFRTWWTENTGSPRHVVLVGTCALQTGSREPARDMYKQWGCLWSTVDTSLKPTPSSTTTTTNNNPLRRSTLMRVYPSNGDNLMNRDLHRFSCDGELLLYRRFWRARRQTGCFSEESFTDSLLLLTRESDANLLLL